MIVGKEIKKPPNKTGVDFPSFLQIRQNVDKMKKRLKNSANRRSTEIKKHDNDHWQQICSILLLSCCAYMLHHNAHKCKYSQILKDRFCLKVYIHVYYSSHRLYISCAGKVDKICHYPLSYYYIISYFYFFLSQCNKVSPLIAQQFL